MASIDDLSAALVKADAAGDTQGATTLANAIRSMQSSGASGPPPAAPAAVAAPAQPSLLGSALATANHAVTDLPVVGAPIQWLGDNLAAQTVGRLSGQDPAAWLKNAQAARTANDAANPIAATAGAIGGNVAATVAAGGTNLGGEALGLTGKLLPRVVNSGLSTLGLGTADNITRGQAPTQALTNAAGPAAIASALPIVGAGVRRLISPLPVSAADSAINATMGREGVDLTAGQAARNKGLQYAESELGGGAAQDFSNKQAVQFTSAALSRAGVNANAATPDVMDGAFRHLGGQFDSLAANNTLLPDRQLGADLSAAADHYNSVVSPTNRAPIVNDTLNDIVGYAQNGKMTGAQYADLRSRLNQTGRALAQSDPHLSATLFSMQSALDSGMERSIASSNPADLAGWQDARRKYANLIVLSNAVAKAGPAAANGVITPANLRTAVQSQNARAYIRGQGDLGPLARAGVASMTPLPQSGTAPRMAVRSIGASVPAVAGALLGSHVAGGDLLAGAAGAAAGAAVPYVAGRALLSDPIRAYLGSQRTLNPTLAEAMQLIARGTNSALAGN